MKEKNVRIYRSPEGGSMPSGFFLQAARFLGVGITATLVHWSIAIALVEVANLTHIVATAVGWLAAVGLSFWGHLKFTFRLSMGSCSRTTIKFFLLSLFNLLLGHRIYLALLDVTPWSYEFLLAVALVVSATLSFFANKLWVFTKS